MQIYEGHEFVKGNGEVVQNMPESVETNIRNLKGMEEMKEIENNTPKLLK